MTQRVGWGGRYAVYDEIASGGMATVYLAARLGPSTEIPSVVALKKLAPQFAKQPEFVAMFLDEAHLAARIRHPNVVTTYEFLRAEEGLGIVMELVVGESFMQLLRSATHDLHLAPLSVSAAVVVDALEGLHAAHEACDDSGQSLGLVHRDVSPHNIILGGDGVARVIDFGIAKAAGRLQTTDVGVIKGKFAYMAPEQIRGSALDRTTDVYAAGVVLWEAIAGRKLFGSSADEDALMQRSAGTVPVPMPSEFNDAAPAGLDEVVLRALSTDPKKRYPTAHALAEAIRAEWDVADPAKVGTWVRSRAGQKLDQLEAKRQAIADSFAGTLSERSGHGPARALPTVRMPTGHPTDVIPTVPELARPMPTQPVPTRQAPPLPGRLAPTMPVPVALIPTLAIPTFELPANSPPRAAPGGAPGAAPARYSKFGGDLVLNDAASTAAAALELDVLPEPLQIAGSSRASDFGPPLVSPPLRRRPLPPPERRSYRGMFVLLVIVLLLAMGGGLFLRGPALLKARALAWASERGLLLKVDRVEPARGGLSLRGVQLSLSGSTRIKLVADEITVELDHGGGIRSAAMNGYALTIMGSASEVAADVVAWRKSRQGSLQIDGKAGHLVWSNLLTSATTIEALDVTLAVVDTTATLDTTNLLLNLPGGRAGPWSAHVESAATETRVRLGLDPSHPDSAPSATFLERRLEGMTWSLDVPRASTFKVGVPAELLGLTSNLSLEVSLHAKAPPEGAPLTVDASVGLYGLSVGGARGGAQAVDLFVSGSIGGDPAKPLPIQSGKLTIGKASSGVPGTVWLDKDGLRVEIDRLSLRGTVVPALVLDTRIWTDPKALRAGAVSRAVDSAAIPAVSSAGIPPVIPAATAAVTAAVIPVVTPPGSNP